MAIVNLEEIELFSSIRKILNRDITVWPEHPNWGAGFSTLLHSGIYQMVKIGGKIVCRRIDFYNYVITHTEAQQVRRDKFAAGVLAWQNLTTDQRKIYNKRAVGNHMSGYNYFLKQYMHG